MKEILRNYYLVAFGLTGVKSTSYYISVFAVSLICLISLSGLALLLKDFGGIRNILIIFTFPYFIGVEILLYLILKKAYPTNKIAYKNPNKPTNYFLAILTLSVAIAVGGYIWFASIPDAVPYK